MRNLVSLQRREGGELLVAGRESTLIPLFMAMLILRYEVGGVNQLSVVLLKSHFIRESIKL